MKSSLWEAGVGLGPGLQAGPERAIDRQGPASSLSGRITCAKKHGYTTGNEYLIVIFCTRLEN